MDEKINEIKSNNIIYIFKNKTVILSYAMRKFHHSYRISTDILKCLVKLQQNSITFTRKYAKVRFTRLSLFSQTC